MLRSEHKKIRHIHIAARTVLYARALLLLDVGEHGQKWIVAKVAEALGTTP